MGNASPARGIWCLLGESATAARYAVAGFDWVLLDMQHGAYDRSRVVDTLRLRTEAWPRTLVRVPGLDAAAIGSALDAGARGVVVPLVDGAADARAAVDAALYPPLGRRSWGPLEPLWGRDAPTRDEANNRTEVWLMIETRGGLDELEEIVAVPGVTSIFVGPYDLSLALGITLEELLAAPDEDAPLRRILAACRAAGIRCGAFGGEPGKAARLLELGFDDVSVATDAGAIDAGAASVLGAAPAQGAGGY
ncbi:HpcH/HpaI aldolase/citrate lyase family protein [Naasia sp. SYSU D00057]|uniref:HpcH/HpaI aldolase family protein n=1 Tax=Naasia sp. SYSU D00057 TaxID=2817380 RepID=UPI001B3141EC|nr:aldolase/citrate lyase family protein [Naasia sp. SYSU D00057]